MSNKAHRLRLKISEYSHNRTGGASSYIRLAPDRIAMFVILYRKALTAAASSSFTSNTVYSFVI